MTEFILGLLIGHFWGDIRRGIKNTIEELKRMKREW